MSSGNIADRVVDDYSGFKVYDERGEKLGKVEYTILDDREQPQYLGVKTGFFGTKTTLIPEELVRLNDSDQEFNVETSENHVKDAPTFDSSDEITSDYENRVRDHYGLGSSRTSSGSSTTNDSDSRDRDSSRDSYDDRDSDRDSRSDRDDREMRSSSSSGDGSFDRDSGSSDSSRNRDDLADRRDDRDSDRGSSGSGAAAGAAGAAGGAAAASSVGRDERSDRNDRDTEVRDTDDIERAGRDRDSSSGRNSGDDREQIRVTLKREKARAERVVDEDGEEEVRIRKRTVREEALVDVEDVEGSDSDRR